MMNAFLDLSASRQIETAIQRAMLWEYPSLITGDPGTGKTTALKHFANQYGGIYCEVKEATKAPGGMYKMLVEAFIGYRSGKTMADDAQQIASYFEREGYFYREFCDNKRQRPLFVDEQQTFEAPALRELLRVCESGNVPLVLAGNRERLAKSRKTDLVALDQIKSRIGHRVHIGSPDAADCQKIAIEFNVEGRDAYDALAAFGGQTNIRELVRLLREAKIVTGGTGSIQLRHIQTAVLSIFGNREALKLLAQSS